jgi:hypothetical protein
MQGTMIVSFFQWDLRTFGGCSRANRKCARVKKRLVAESNTAAFHYCTVFY